MPLTPAHSRPWPSPRYPPHGRLLLIVTGEPGSTRRLVDGLTLAEEPKHRPTKHIEAPDLAGTVRTPREHHAPQLAHPHRAANTRPGARLRPRTRPQYCLARATGRAMLSAATTSGRSGNVLPLRGTPLRGCTTPIRNQRCRSLRRSVPASRR